MFDELLMLNKFINNYILYIKIKDFKADIN